MPRLALLAGGFSLCAGCALVSGLSSLDVAGDAGSVPTPDGGDADGGSRPDSSSNDAKPDNVTIIDASPDGATPHPPGVLCGSSVSACKQNEKCCKATTAYACAPTCSDLSIQCDDWSDCGGDGDGKACCVSLNPSQTAVTAVACEDLTSCVGKALLCDPAAPNACPSGLKCVGPPPIGLTSNYVTCK